MATHRIQQTNMVASLRKDCQVTQLLACLIDRLIAERICAKTKSKTSNFFSFLQNSDVQLSVRFIMNCYATAMCWNFCARSNCQRYRNKLMDLIHRPSFQISPNQINLMPDMKRRKIQRIKRRKMMCCQHHLLLLSQKQNRRKNYELYLKTEKNFVVFLFVFATASVENSRETNFCMEFDRNVVSACL